MDQRLFLLNPPYYESISCLCFQSLEYVAPKLVSFLFTSLVTRRKLRRKSSLEVCNLDGVYTLQFAPQLGHQILAPTVAQKVSQIGERTDFHLAL